MFKKSLDRDNVAYVHYLNSTTYKQQPISPKQAERDLAPVWAGAVTVTRKNPPDSQTQHDFQKGSRKMLKFKSLVAATALVLVSSAAMAADIVDTAVAAGSFKTLAAALQKAGLVDTLKGEGPFTVFAPTDAAFAKIPKAQLDALLADKAMLTKVLTYHVVAGKVMAANVKAGPVKTVEGENLTISIENGRVMADKSTVTKTDIVASNGVIHVIDSVMMPN
ncbi:MAG: fasciclin domain-containing protein [Usitatibacter sp.]